MPYQKTTAELATTFKELHQPGSPVVLPNVWDGGSALHSARGRTVIAATTSTCGIAVASGLQDSTLTSDVTIKSARTMAPAFQRLNKPFAVDIQDGYADELEYVIEEMINMGVTGVTLGDFSRKEGRYTTQQAVARIKLVLSKAKELGVPDFVVDARCDALALGGATGEVIERGTAYLLAGATTVFVWRGRQGLTREEVSELTAAFGGRLSVLLSPDTDALTVPELSYIGVARIATGHTLFLNAMRRLVDDTYRVVVPRV